jgi:hypothetical protein
MISAGRKKERILDSLTAWNYNQELDRMMTYELVIRPEFDKNFVVGSTRLTFNDDSVQLDFKDLSGNRASIDASRIVTLATDPTVTAHICAVSGPTLVSNVDAMPWSWGVNPDTHDTADQVPLFPYFGVTINLLAMTGPNAQRNTNMLPGGGNIDIGGRNFTVRDFDTALVLFSTEVSIFDLLGYLVASPSTNKGLHAEYTIGQIREYLGMAGIEARLQTMNLTEIETYFSISPARFGTNAPDTLRPLYPTTVTLGYDFLSKNCGPHSGTNGNKGMCVAAWNCLNGKGRLVAPGGYIARQFIRAGTEVTEVTRKMVVTNRKK